MRSDVSYDWVFQYDHLFRSFLKCLKAVSWKGSVQAWAQLGITNVYRIYTSLAARQLPRPKNIRKFTIHERGKEREIISIYIGDRVVQRTLCDYALVPVLSRSLIYDNGACIKGKGTSFSRKRFVKFLSEAARKWKNDFWFLVFDFEHFFASVPHSLCYEILDRSFEDKDIVDLTMRIIKSYEPERDHGLTLGSQVSQILAVASANKLDHDLKDRLRVKYYIRHMDDGVVIAKDKDELIYLLDEIKRVSTELGFKLHPKKTRIVPASKGIRFLKVNYTVTQTGKIVRRMNRRSVTVQRRKLKTLASLYRAGKAKMDDVYASMTSWMSSADKAMSYKTKRSMLKLYKELFGKDEADRLRKKVKW